ncbi:hypothetical protein BV898_06753 [Hypsibius exemplaris]|uniref:Uncharacterized protein n=1 Tax=Hypsibius exemplaris TaxID=2072580 RepID=A0A1W0WVE4_HYPEX|nr:hypothetical protein BV898_06753 [Hypsibius exemplaris]
MRALLYRVWSCLVAGQINAPRAEFRVAVRTVIALFVISVEVTPGLIIPADVKCVGLSVRNGLLQRLDSRRKGRRNKLTSTVHRLNGPSTNQTDRPPSRRTVHRRDGPSTIQTDRPPSRRIVYRPDGPSIVETDRLSSRRTVHHPDGPSTVETDRLSSRRTVHRRNGSSIVQTDRPSSKRTVHHPDGLSIRRCDRLPLRETVQHPDIRLNRHRSRTSVVTPVASFMKPSIYESDVPECALGNKTA